jgi:hypothetical protein
MGRKHVWKMETGEQVTLETEKAEKEEHLTLRYDSKTKKRYNIKLEIRNCLKL